MRRAQPNSNFGTLQTVQVDPAILTTTRGLFRFNVSQIPEGSAVASATLRLCVTTGSQPGEGHTHELRRVASPWTELGVNWNNQPPVSAAVSATQVVSHNADCLYTEVTPDVQAWVDGADNYGWQLSDQAETLLGGEALYGSREQSSPSYRPQLVVTYFPPDEVTYYLHDDPSPPTGDSTSLPVLPMAPAEPVATTLHNYDTDLDASPGMVIKNGGDGAVEADPTKFQTWKGPAASTPYTIDGGVSMTLWSAMKDFTPNKAGAIVVFLRDCFNASCTTIGVINYAQPDWQSGSSNWHSVDLAITVGTYTMDAGHWLELKIVVPEQSDDDLWFAYDTVSYDAHMHVPLAIP